VKAKHQRLALLGLAVVAVLVATLLAMSALKDQAAYFYSPGDVARKGLPVDRPVRIGGMVRAGSITHSADGITVHFVVGDDTDATIPVRYSGILPDLFKENGGVVADGRFEADGQFVASEILAKHDENYRPPELAGDRHKVGAVR
jgi:cytochrome c-type biogenesis protein CcmE